LETTSLTLDVGGQSDRTNVANESALH